MKTSALLVNSHVLAHQIRGEYRLEQRGRGITPPDVRTFCCFFAGSKDTTEVDTSLYAGAAGAVLAVIRKALGATAGEANAVTVSGLIPCMVELDLLPSIYDAIQRVDHELVQLGMAQYWYIKRIWKIVPPVEHRPALKGMYTWSTLDNATVRLALSRLRQLKL